MSYWHCEWVPEFVVEIFNPQSLRMFWRKVDPEHPPEIEDLPSKHTENDPLNLESRCYSALTSKIAKFSVFYTIFI